MSTGEIISSLCDDKDLTEGLTKILDENGVKQLRLLESLSPESELFKKVMSSLEADDALKLKAPLASVVLSSAAKEASAQLKFAVSNAIASAPKSTTTKDRLSFASAIRKVQSELGDLVFIPSQRMLELLYRGGTHTFVNFNSQMAKSSQKDVEVAVTPDGAPVLIKGGSQLSFDFENSQRDEPTRYGPSSAQFLKVFFTWSSAVLIVQSAISNGTGSMVHKSQTSTALNEDVVDALPSGNDLPRSEDAAQALTDLPVAVAPHHFMAYLSRLLQAAASHGWKAAISADARIRQKVDDLVRSEHMTFPQALTNEMVASPIIVDVVASMQIDSLRRNYNNNSSAKPFTNRKRARIDNGMSKVSTDFGSSRDSTYGKGKGRGQKSSSLTTSPNAQSTVQSSKPPESKSP